MNDVVKILRAFRPGDVVFLEIDAPLTVEMANRIKEHFDLALKDTGVRAVILERGIRVAAAEETIDTSHLQSAQVNG